MKTATIFLVLFVVGASQASTELERWNTGGIGSVTNPIGFPVSLIFNGILVPDREIPGIVALIDKRAAGRLHDCGGSIVNENYIVTAAHCILNNREDMKVLSGTNSLVRGGIRHNVLETHVHEGYNVSDSWINDIAVVKVDPPFVFDEKTAPVALPQQGQETPAGSTATVAGWGYTENGTLPNDLLKVSIQIWNQDECNRIYNELHLNVYPEQICASTEEGNEGSCGDELRMIKVPIFDHEECKRRYQRANITVIPEQICTSTEGRKGFFKGDSGGPLFVNNQLIGLMSLASFEENERWPGILTRVSAYVDWINHKYDSGGPLFVDGQVIGLVSWAKGCSLKGWPTVYTRVSAYIDWINSKVSS
ncbi:hypothetical protein J437_LFUL009255 [Ladona fulva]|uniref:Peptidase S1 domain-containing protein n=1 Tax=Ladona fulva TaxID=123851 RepID=A0A8K0KHP2_LADFU|nr:hypothetical protein J437_LFUL009255 [Ladona fulva]